MTAPGQGGSEALAAVGEAADWFRARLLATPGCVTRAPPHAAAAPPGLEWSNTLLESPLFRRAHVETLHVPARLCVLHVCLWPHLDDAAPIFGFDMIAGAARVTGIFLDLSATAPHAPVLRLPDVADAAALRDFAERRTLPDWGTEIFSPDMLAVRPADPAEVERAIDLACAALSGWLAAPRRPDPALRAAVAAGQRRYVAAQRRNDHTRRMLAGLIGAEPARRFIEEVLFPPVPSPTEMLADKAAAG